ncbi:hypothetical protein PROFUN_15044 [Planoprotostelium fungivorum]|uniref:Tyrosine phosphatase family protein n=1 Tax=Planoprotostelium fungivorum TaxID=1890364 RepID=A0A2P6MZR0_9EUKA|nr:hypothetical protein PROFUN_15044 [Planoprotostelium fungivorum]
MTSDHYYLLHIKVGFPPDSNRERKGQTLKQEAGLYHSAIGAPDMYSQNSQELTDKRTVITPRELTRIIPTHEGQKDWHLVNFGAKIRASPVSTNTLTQKKLSGRETPPSRRTTTPSERSLSDRRHPQTKDKKSRHHKGGRMIITPLRFSIVEDQLYRGSYPNPKNFKFLKRLKLKTIVSLVPTSPTAELAQFCREQQINNIHFSCPKFKEEDGKVTASPTVMSQILTLMIDTDNLPLFIHCLDGAHTTGVVIMCLRRIQNWNLSVIFSEFTRYTRDAHIGSEESNYVESFKKEVIIPMSIPLWLWQGQRVTNHMTMNIKLLQESDFTKKEGTKRTVHAHWKESKDDNKRNFAALALDTPTNSNFTTSV